MISPPRPLIEVFAEMPDFRSARGKRHPLAAILALTWSALLCGARSYPAIAEWERNYGARLMQALGFTPPAAVCRDAPHRFAAGGPGDGGSQAGGMG